MITENVSTLQIHKLTQEQYEIALENGELNNNSIYLTPTVISDYALKSDLETKADLVDGKIPLNQIPEGIGGGGNSQQIQADYNQMDDTQVDFIKNKPFYSIPPEISFNFDFYRSKEPITWDGVILPNHPSISIPGSNMVYYKVSDNFITSADCLNCYMKYSLAPEVMGNDMPEEMKEYYMYLPCAQEIMTQFTFFENADMFLNTFALSFNITGNIPLDDLGISLDVLETGTYFLYDATGDALAPGYVKAIEGSLKTDLTDPDLANDPDLLPIADIYGSGTLLLAKKISSEFLPVDKILNATLGMNMATWNMEDMDSSMSVKMIMSENMLSNGIDVIFADDNTSYGLIMEGGIPLFASISSPLATFDNGLQIPGPGIYFAYNNLGREQGEMELWINSFTTAETVFQIDPKYIPKIKTTEVIESNNKTPVSSQGVYEALGNRNRLNVSGYVNNYSSDPISSYAVYQALGYRERLPDIVTTPDSNSEGTRLISSYGVYQGLKQINNYLSSGDYNDYNYTSLKYRGSNLRPISQENSYSPDQSGTILWFYE